MTKFIAALLIGSMIGISISFASSSDKFTIYGTQDNIKVTLTPDGAPEMNLEGLIKFDLRIADDPKVLDEARHSKVSVTVRDLSLIVFAFPYSVIASNHINLQSTVGLGGLSFRPGATILLTQDSVKDLKGDIPLEMPLPTKGPQIKEVDELDYLETSTRFQKGLLSLRLEFEKPKIGRAHV